MAIAKVYKDSIHTENDVSAQILGITELRYGINPDWSPEFPEVTITTATSGWAVDDKVIIVDAADSDKQIMFYVAEISYDYGSRKYSLRCPHILAKLDDIPVTDWLMGPWWDAIPTGDALTYDYYNYQNPVPTQGDSAWVRDYVQVGFMIACMIYRVSGTSIADIDIDTLNAKNSFYVDGTTTLTYKQLGVNNHSVRRTGEETNDAWEDTSFKVQDTVLTMLQYLKYLCSATKISIDILRKDYQLNVIIPNSAAPAAAATLGKRVNTRDLYRYISMTRSGLDASDAQLPVAMDMIYQWYDAYNIFYDYTYGEDGDDIAVITSSDEAENTAATEAETLDVTYPINFRLYRIQLETEATYQYRSYIELISATTPNPDQPDYMQWVPAMADFWYDTTQVIEYEIALTTLEMKWPVSRIDLAKRRQTYERWT